MSRTLALSYGVAGYAVFLATFLYLIGFVTGLVVPVTVDAGGAAAPPWAAALIDVGLVALFGLQHTVMARPRSKRALTRVLPASIERTTFMLATCAVFAVMFTQWRPIPIALWSLGGAAAWIVQCIGFLGWGTVLLSTFLIDHFDLFGLRQTWLAFRGRPYAQKPFQERGLYRLVRHPLMLGFLVAFWSAPVMTVGHAVLAGSYTVYILIALSFEERDLVALHGEAYRDYRRRVPRLLPRGRPARTADRTTVAAG
jgi:protein-S-isoprenylcysteine O-methyltransferase Ste14